MCRLFRPGLVGSRTSVQGREPLQAQHRPERSRPSRLAVAAGAPGWLCPGALDAPKSRPVPAMNLTLIKIFGQGVSPICLSTRCKSSRSKHRACSAWCAKTGCSAIRNGLSRPKKNRLWIGPSSTGLRFIGSHAQHQSLGMVEQAPKA